MTGKEAGFETTVANDERAERRDRVAYMSRALELARRGVGWCSPNPPVGAVIVRDGTIVGEGFHALAGGPHAEIEAIARAGDRCSGASLYVSLEPCNHHGRTPPCTNAIVAAGIAEVIVATTDPNPSVRGGGLDELRSEGVIVAVGVLEAEARELIRMFAFHATTGRPYVVAKYGASLDGKVATRDGQSKWITTAKSRKRVHDLRHAVDAIVVGVDTVIADDPKLNSRRSVASANPLPVVLDSCGRIPFDAALVRDARENRLIVATTVRMPGDTRRSLEDAGVRVWPIPADEHGRVDCALLLARLEEAGVQSVLVEGGAKTLGSFFDAGLVNEVWAFIAPLIIGGSGAPGAVGGAGVAALNSAHRFGKQEMETLDGDVLIRLS